MTRGQEEVSRYQELNSIKYLRELFHLKIYYFTAGHCEEGSPASNSEAQPWHPDGSNSLIGGDYIVKIGDQELGNFELTQEVNNGTINLNVGESYTVTITGPTFKGLNFRMPKLNIFTVTDSNFKLNTAVCNEATESASAVTHGSGTEKTSTSFSMQVSEAGAVRLDVTIMQQKAFWYWSYFNLNFVEPSPTTSPTASPTSAPTNSPTASPTKSPSAAPSVIPSALPSSDPVGTPQLTDATSLFQKRKKNGSIAYKGCDWISGNTDKFEKRCGNEKHASHCPKTCQKEEYRCSDSLHTFQFTKANGKQRDKKCSFLLNKPDKLSNRCQKEIFKTTCRATCLSANSVDGC